jgi:hypothetical protein
LICLVKVRYSIENIDVLIKMIKRIHAGISK